MESLFSTQATTALALPAELLEARGYKQTASGNFSNGRATIRLDYCGFAAIPANGGKAWHADVREATPESLAQLLQVILAAPGFQSQAEIDHRENRRLAAETALASIAESIRENPDTHSGQQLRRFVWSLFNGHHPLNLWRMKNVLDSQHNAAVTEVFTGWMEGSVSDDALRRALTHSGEMDRWETIRLQAPEQSRLVDAVDAVSDLLNLTLPGEPMTQISRANTLLREVMDEQRMAEETPARC